MQSDVLPSVKKVEAMEIIDSHCHFDFSDFDNDRESVWKTCKSQGMTSLIIPGVYPEQWQQASKISADLSGVYFSAGLHPWWIDKSLPDKNIKNDLEDTRALIIRHSQNKNCVAVGECGLDKLISTPLERQIQVFELHLEVANELAKPLIVHCRKVHNEVIQLLSKHSLSTGGVIHGFSGSLEVAEKYWSMGFRLGVGGTITYERAKKTRSAFARMPLEALLLETDAPDMPIQGKQGERNSPHYLPEILRELSNIRSDSINEVAKQTTLNAQTLFSL